MSDTSFQSETACAIHEEAFDNFLFNCIEPPFLQKVILREQSALDFDAEPSLRRVLLTLQIQTSR